MTDAAIKKVDAALADEEAGTDAVLISADTLAAHSGLMSCGR